MTGTSCAATYMEVVAKNLGGVSFPATATARAPEDWYFTK